MRTSSRLRRQWTVALCVTSFLAAMLPGPAAAEVEWECGATIAPDPGSSKPRTVKLNHDIPVQDSDSEVEGCSQGGLVIGADDFTLDLNGHTVRGGSGVQDGAGVRTDGFRDITIKNGTITGFDIGVFVEAIGQSIESPRSTGGAIRLEELKIVNNVGDPSSLRGDGVLIVGSSDNVVEKNTIRGNGPFSGIRLVGLLTSEPGISSVAKNNVIKRNEIDANVADISATESDTGRRSENVNTGIRIGPGATGTLIEDNTVTGSGLDGISVSTKSTSDFLPGDVNIVEDSTGPVFSEYAGPVSGTVIRGNGVKNNGGHDKPHRPGDGIRVEGSGSVEATQVAGNTVCGNRGNGILVAAGHTGIVDNDVGEGTHGCAPNALDGAADTFELHDSSGNDLASASRLPSPLEIPPAEDPLLDRWTVLLDTLVEPARPAIRGARESADRALDPARPPYESTRSSAQKTSPALPCSNNHWEGNFTLEDEVSHPCTTQRSDADLAIEVVDSPDPQIIGEEVVYDVQIRNLGPKKASLAKLDVDLGSGLALVSTTAAPGECNYAPPNLRCDLGTIMAGKAAALGIGAIATRPGRAEPKFSVKSSAPDAKSGDNTVTASTVILAEEPIFSVADVSVVEGDRGNVPAEFGVYLSEALGSQVSVKYRTRGGSAEEGTDYSSVAEGMLEFAPGETVKTVSVPVMGDEVFENEETFSLELFHADGARLSGRRGLGVILDDDIPISIRDVSVVEGDEGAAKARFVTTLARSASVPVSVRYETSPGTALSPVDFLPSSGTIEFEPGQESQRLTIEVHGDLDPEPDEDFFVQLSNSRNAALGAPRARGLVMNDDTPKVSVGTRDFSAGRDKNVAQVAEGDESRVEPLMSRAQFHISLSKAVSQPVWVDFATAELPQGRTSPGAAAATPGEDYKQVSGRVVFAPGQTEKVESVVIVGDLANEFDEEFAFALLGSDKGEISSVPGRGRIEDDDEGDFPALSAFAGGQRRSCGGLFVSGHSPEATAWRDDTGPRPLQTNSRGSRRILTQSVAYVSRDTPNPRLLYVTDVRPGSASSGGSMGDSSIDGVHGQEAHFGIVSMRRTFGSFDVASASVPVETPGVRNLRTVDLGNYDVVVVASADHGGRLSQAELDVLNARSQDLGRFVLGGGGIVAFQERGQISLPGRPLTGAFRFLPVPAPPVNFGEADGNATALRVTGVGRAIGLTDEDVNGNQHFQWFPFTSGWNVVDIDTHAPTIRNQANKGYWEESKDGLPVSLATRNPIGCRLYTEPVAMTEGDSGTKTFDFNVKLLGTEPQPVTVRYSTSDGEATAGQDYVASDGSFTFAPGETSKTVSVAVRGDIAVEQDETFSLRLAFAIGSETAEVHAAGTIINDDGQPPSSIARNSQDLLRPETGAISVRQDQPPGQDAGAAASRQQNPNQPPPAQPISQAQPKPHLQWQLQAESQVQPQLQIQAQVQQQMQTQAQSQIQAAAAPMIEAASQAEVRVEQVRDSDRREDRERRPRNDGYRAAARSPYPQALLSFGGWFVGMMGLVLGLSRTGQTNRPSTIRVQSGLRGARGLPRPPRHRRRFSG